MYTLGVRASGQTNLNEAFGFGANMSSTVNNGILTTSLPVKPKLDNVSHHAYEDNEWLGLDAEASRETALPSWSVHTLLLRGSFQECLMIYLVGANCVDS